MAAKPETQFYRSVHSKLPLDRPYRVKMSNPYAGGIPDVWYSGDKADLWVEYKFTKLPLRSSTVVFPDLSELQKGWLRARLLESRNVAVILGSKAGGVVFEGASWQQEITQKEYLERLQTRTELANWILKITCHGSST